jgi:poly-gamma-glutamate capsule biosynthesis protein CapA/YwtB (metallophosphatase superfamily)
MKLFRSVLLLSGMPFLWGQEAPRTLTIAAVGDTMVGSVYPSRAAMPPEDGRRVFERVRHLWRGADLVTGNFEGTVCSDVSLVRELGANSYRFLVPVEGLAIYKNAGFSLLNIANNHAADAGLPGREATVAGMDGAGLAHVGSLDQPCSVLTVQGLKVGVLGAAPHMNCYPLDVQLASERVKALKETEGCALVVVSMHAGAEGEKALHVPKAREIYLDADRGDVYAFAHAMIDAGADLVLGHGPHVLRGMEVYRDRLIAYSLGNFATYGCFNVKGVNGLGLVLEAVLLEDGSLKGLRIHSTRQDKGTEGWSLGIPVEPDPREEARKLVEKLSFEDLQTDLARYYLPDMVP